MHDELVTVLENKKINAKYWKLVFKSQKLSRKVMPGQFMNIRIEDDTDPFLRRPFSYYRASANRVEILYEVLGRGSAILSKKKKGDTVEVLGPLGKPFTQKLRGKKRVLIAGGIGIPPLVFLAETVSADCLIVGCKSKKEVLPKSEFKKVKAKICYATEDGSYGKRGLVTDLLCDKLENENPENIFLQVCGPHGMLKAVLQVAAKYGVEGEASFDERMACGIGACLGCVVKTNAGYKTSCVDGPVFRFDEVEI